MKKDRNMGSSFFASLLVLSILFLQPAAAQRYERLWKNAFAEQEQGRPVSAGKLVEKIREKALLKKNGSQEMAAFLAGASLRQQITPDSFYVDFPELERRVREADGPVERAVYATFAAEICQENRHRGQWLDVSDTDSLPLEYWSREDYTRRALYYHVLSLADPEALSAARMKDFTPLFIKGTDDRTFDGDLLHVIGRRALNGMDRLNADEEVLKEYAGKIRTAYRKRNNREAELLFTLDSIRMLSHTRIGRIPVEKQDSVLYQSEEYQAYAALMTRFEDLPAVAEVYLQASRMGFSTPERVRMLEQGIKRCPRYDRIAALKDELKTLSQPYFCWVAEGVAIPGDSLPWIYHYRHLKNASCRVYAVSSVLQDTLRTMPGNEADRMLRRYGVFVEEVQLPMLSGSSPYKMVTDTLLWKVPAAGHYALLFTSRSADGEQMECQQIQASALRVFSLSESDGEMLDLVVTDARSGAPRAGARLEITSPAPAEPEDRRVVVYTDAEGRALVDLSAFSHYVVRAICPGDTMVMDPSFKRLYPVARPEQTLGRIYSDRAVYRPGQQVHLTGLLARSKEGRYQVWPDTLLPLSVFDVSGKEVYRDTVRTDSWGGWETVYTLPEQGTMGQYRVSVGDDALSFSVEEYTRPSFELELDRMEPRYVAWGDTLRVSGLVRNYNGAPVAGARVTARFHLSDIYYVLDEKLERTDTLQTGADGRFVFSFPVSGNPGPESSDYMFPALVSCTALHPSGEQAAQSMSAQVVTLKKQLDIQIPEVLDIDTLTTVRFDLTNTRREKLAGTVFYTFVPADEADAGGTVRSSGKYVANKPFPLQGLKGLPSGRYVLKADALIDGDTVKARREVILYTRRDTRVPVDTAFWFRVLQPDFSEERPFVCEIGSSEQEVTLYYTLCSGGKIRERKVIVFSDSLFTLTVPYLPAYDKGASLHLAFVRNNTVYSRSIGIEQRMEQPKLRYKWLTFRDLLVPGAQENWTLQITDEEGHPASVRALFTLYDASLDEICRHYWYSVPTVSYNAYVPSWNIPYLSTSSFSTYFPLSASPLPELRPAEINLRLLGAYGAVMGKSVPMAKNMVLMESTVRMDRAGGASEDLSVTEEAEESPAEEPVGLPDEALSSLRTNLQETAYFNGGLYSDAEGRIRLSVTMPEALTRWNLMGLAYTRDLAYCRIDTTVVTRRQLMAQLFMPAYLYVGDRAVLKTTLTNLTGENDRGSLTLEIADAETDSVIYVRKQAFQVPGNASAQYAFEFTPQRAGARLVCRVWAEGLRHADGEQRELYVQPATVPVTYARPFVIDGKGRQTIALPAVNAYDERQISPSSWFLEYHTDPLFAALQVLPVLQHTESKGAEDLAAVYYATVCSAHLMKTRPQVGAWLTRWDDPQYIRQEEEWWTWMRRLSLRLWDETPWSLQKEEADKRFADLYRVQKDTVLAREHARQLLDRLVACQQTDGSFGWMPGMRGNASVTARVLALMERLQPYTGVWNDAEMARREQLLRSRAFLYLKKEFLKASAGIQAGYPRYMDETFLWLAARHLGADEALKTPAIKEAVGALRRTCSSLPNDRKIRVAGILHAYGYKEDALSCLRSVQEYLVTDSMGAVFFDARLGGETAGDQRLMLHLSALEQFRALMPDQETVVQGMLRWLLLQKRTQGWANNYLSACAVQTLLDQAPVSVSAAGRDTLLLRTGERMELLPEAEDGLPVVRYVLPLERGAKRPEALIVGKQDERMTWGTAYTQYDLSPEQVIREQKAWGDLSVEVSQMPDSLRVGDEMKVHYLLRADRDYDYMLLRVRSAACCRPSWLTSGYRSVQGVGYYLSLEEDGMLLYFDHLPKGNYVLELPYQVQFQGTYLHGGAEFQSYYAPEFRTYMPGRKIEVHD